MFYHLKLRTEDMKEIELCEKIQKEIEKLFTISEDYVTSTCGAHEIEQGLLKQLLKLGYFLLLHIIEKRILLGANERIVAQKDEIIVRKGNSSRNYLSIFGLMVLTRPSFWSKERGKMYLSDELLQLPPVQNSYFLQSILGESASENNYQQSVRVVNQVLNLKISACCSERNACQLGELVDEFYETLPVEVQPEAVCFSASFDGKGVPKVKKKATSAVDMVKENPKKKLGKGEKRNVMQMATVSVTSCFIPKVRTRDSVLKGLIDSTLPDVNASKTSITIPNTPNQNDNNWHQHIHKRAFLADQLKAVDYGIRHIKAQISHPNSRFVVPIDAGIGLEEKVLQAVTKYELNDQFDGIILDIIHVSEYVWEAATAIFGEQAKEKYPFVKAMLEDLLDTKTTQVIDQLKNVIQNNALSDHKIKQVQKTITYFENHRHNMDYKKFIDKGYPVSSALVEAACGHLVKQRMEQSGMRWSSTGAQNILDVRAVKINNHFDPFMQFVIQRQTCRNLLLVA
jgi:hypothetical protein